MTEMEYQPLLLADLIEEIDEDMVPVVFIAFLEDTTGVIESIETAIQEEKAIVLRKQAHKMKGSLLSIRALNAAALAKRIEYAGDSAAFAEAAAALPEFKAEFAKVKDYIDAYLIEHPVVLEA